MEKNILKNKDILDVCLIYADGENKLIESKASVQFIDEENNTCYLISALPLNMSKPKFKCNVKVIVYTKSGIYKSETKIADMSLSVANIVYNIDIPKYWKYVQMRYSERIPIDTPIEIKYNDGYEITGKTTELSITGFAFMSETEIPELYAKLKGVGSINLVDKNGSNIISEDVKFVRKIEPENDADQLNHYVYKFVNISDRNRFIIRNFVV